jgi:hypothetical protein
MSTSERSLGLQWVAATVVGWLIGFAACEALQSFLTTVFVDGLVIGSAIGVAQWLVLRRQISPVGFWPVASIVGFGAGKALSDSLLPGTATLAGYALSGAVIGAVVGLMQGLVLGRSLRSALWWIPASAVAWGIGWIPIGLAENGAGLSTIGTYLVSAVGAALAGIITGIALILLDRNSGGHRTRPRQRADGSRPQRCSPRPARPSARQEPADAGDETRGVAVSPGPTRHP